MTRKVQRQVSMLASDAIIFHSAGKVMIGTKTISFISPISHAETTGLRPSVRLTYSRIRDGTKQFLEVISF